MIWLCGDTHGKYDFDKVDEFFECMTLCGINITKEDYLIILGDVGVCWDEEENDELIKEILHRLPCSVLWIDGNHENFDVLNTYKVSEWHGGKVHFISKDIIHLMRGQVYEIEGKSFFTFGGGYSVDRDWRIEGESWWPQEMPSVKEYEEGICNLDKVGNHVDYILSHTCPSHVAEKLVEDIISGEEELQEYLRKIAEHTEFKMWYFGHWHMDQTEGSFRCLWYDIIEIK